MVERCSVILRRSVTVAVMVLGTAGCNRTTDMPSPEPPLGSAAFELRRDSKLTETSPSVGVGELTEKSATQAADDAPVAVVELFTSEGCSSCPPADENLAALVHETEATHAKVFPLSFHVDYWNYLGWSDPFSSEEYSNRQRAYAKAWESRRVYTPQMVVNGQTEFVGSDRTQLERAVKGALRTRAEATVRLGVTRTGDHALRVIYDVTTRAQKAGTRLTLTVVQREATVDVDSGENSGQKLTHRNVVRRIETVVDPKHGQWDVKLPPDCPPQGAFVVGYVQGPDWAVIGANAASPGK
jgi:hypothetical protein